MGNDLGPILLTGATGYLGGHVIAKLQARRLSFVATSLGGAAGGPCDLTSADSVRALLGRAKPSVVIHCAAAVPKTASAYNDTEAADASIAMLKTLADNADCPIVFASSMTVYGAAVECPADEASRPHPDSAYARGKWAAEQLLFDRKRSGDVALRLPGLFGLPRRSGVMYTAAKAFLTRGNFALTASDEPWAAMTVDDAAEYLVRAGTSRFGTPSQVVNVCYEGEFSVPSAVAQIAACCGVAWRPPSTNAKAFSMRLQRLESRYGSLQVTFSTRLEDFVRVVHRDLAGGETPPMRRREDPRRGS